MDANIAGGRPMKIKQMKTPKNTLGTHLKLSVDSCGFAVIRDFLDLLDVEPHAAHFRLLVIRKFIGGINPPFFIHIYCRKFVLDDYGNNELEKFGFSGNKESGYYWFNRNYDAYFEVIPIK
jgi:hypothetical protein